MPEDVPLHIYDEMVDKARRAGTTVPEGTDAAMTWAPDGRGWVTYGDHTDVASPAYTTFHQDDGSEYLRVDPAEIGGP